MVQSVTETTKSHRRGSSGHLVGIGANSPCLDSPSGGRVTRFERWLLRRLLKNLGKPPVEIVLWNGERFTPPGQPVASIRIPDRRVFWRIVSDPMYEFCEAYSTGRIEFTGDLSAMIAALYRSLRAARIDDRKLRLAGRRRGRRNTLRGSRDNINHHYDIGNDFYKLWLDQELVYTCAYFAEPTFSLEEAQAAKMDHVCRKLWLRPDETVVELGCGWGALALHMARNHGVRVKAYNISREQIAHAQARAKAENLADRVEFVLDDWRAAHGSYDVVVSVGMLEHVGRENHQQFGDVIDRCLKPTGRGLVHSIGQSQSLPINAWIERRIFPGAEAPTLSEMVGLVEPRGLSVLDVENLRLHYAETLRQWLDRFERSVESVEAMFDAPFVRMWRLYLAGSLAAFDAGRLELFQVLFARQTQNDIPRTRARLHE